MRDLTPEEREQIYLEEKARREGPTGSESSAPSAPAEPAPAMDPAEAEAEERRANLQRLQKEEQETRLRVQALLAFERQEKDAQQHRAEKLKQDYEEKKAQEKLRLDKWQRGNQRQLERLANWAFFFGILLLLVAGFAYQLSYISVPIFCCLILGRIMKVPARWMAGFGVMAIPVLWCLHQSWLETASPPVRDEISYQAAISRQQSAGKQAKLNAAQLFDLATRDVAQVDPDLPDIRAQRILLRQAKAELLQIEGPERNSPKVKALSDKIDVLWLAINTQGERSHP